MIPFTPHLSNECLNYYSKSTDKWPEIRNVLEEVKFAIQVNGKTRYY